MSFTATVFNVHDVILLLTAFICVLFSILLFTIKTNSRRQVSNFYLALFLLQQAAIPLDILISFGQEFRAIAFNISPDLFYIFGFSYWLEAPLLLWYVRSMIYENYRLQWHDVIFLTPFLLYLAHQIVFYYGMGVSWRITQIEEYNIIDTPNYMHGIMLSRELFRVFLGALCLYELNKYRHQLRAKYASIEKDELSWLSLLVIGFTALRGWAVLVLVFVILNTVFAIRVNFEIMGLIGNYTTLLLVSLLVFFSLGHSGLHEGVDRKSESDHEINYDEVYSPELKQSVLDSLENQQLYLRSNLTLERMADHLQIAPRILSGVINRQFNCNFFELINRYRIEAAKAQLIEHPEKTVLTILFDAGFNSKTTFNTLFKRKTGFTPTQFKDKHLK